MVSEEEIKQLIAEAVTAPQESVRATDIVAPVAQSTVPVVLKIDCTSHPTHARITSRDGKIDMLVPLGIVSRKFAEGASKVEFFKATVGDSIEIDDRVSLPQSETW